MSIEQLFSAPVTYKIINSLTEEELREYAYVALRFKVYQDAFDYMNAQPNAAILKVVIA